MVRLVGLTLTAVLMAFQLWYTHAPAHQRAYVPGWVQSGANVASHFILDVSDTVGDLIGPPAKRGWEETKMKLGMMDRPEAAREGMMAVGGSLVGQSFVAQRLGEATFLGADLTDTDFTKAYLVRAMFDGATAEASVFDDAIMETVSMRTAKMTGASFKRADLSAIQAQGADLRADFTEANLSRAQLSASDMSGATLVGARMDRAILFRTNLAGADLTGATGLLQDQLNAACGDAATVLPQGLTVPVCETGVASLR